MDGTQDCQVTTDPIDACALLVDSAAPTDGASILLLGVVRNENEGRSVGHLDYQAYPAMAEATLREIVAEAHQKWATGAIKVVHRIGHLAVGEASVAIVVSAPHRDAAYSASRYVIEE